MATATGERRRSDRIWLSIPVRAEGVDSATKPFECEARAISVARHGARIQIRQSLSEGQTVRLTRPGGGDTVEFRVVASFSLPESREGVYGVECLDLKSNFWGIEFPKAESEDPVDGKVLVECRKCRTVALLPLSLSEVEALRAMGLVGKPCSHCNTISLWKYAQEGAPPNRKDPPTGDSTAESVVEDAPESGPSGPYSVERTHRRIYALMPVGIRDAKGSEEKTRTENVSKGGFCFTSEKKYKPGETVLAIFPHDSVAPKTELPAQIVRAQKIEGSERRIYGVAYSQD